MTIALEKRGGRQGWFGGADLHSSVQVPFNTEIVFHCGNEQKEATIPANEINYISLASK